MAFKRSAVRSRVAPPIPLSVFCFFIKLCYFICIYFKLIQDTLNGECIMKFKISLSKKINFLCFFFSIYVSADVIQYSGISYVSSNENIQDMFPNTLKIESSIRKTIYNELTLNKDKNANLNLGVSDSFRDGSYSTIIAIENENISTINLNNNCLRTFSLGIQVITFNTKDQQIVSISPNAIRRIYYDEPINGSCKTTNRKINLLRFAEIFYGLDIPKNDYDKFLPLSDNEIVNKISASSNDTKSFAKESEIIGSVLKDVLNLDINTIKNTVFFVGIDNVELEELASSQLSGNKEFEHNYLFTDFFGDFQEESYKTWAGQQFSKWFSNTYNYPLIPYVKGRALGRDVSMKFADGSEALNLRLPSLDFGFVIKIKGFKKVKLDESKLREAYAWAAFSVIEFHNVGVKKIAEINLKHVHTEEVNKGDSVDDWNNFNLSQNRIMKDYVTNLMDLDTTWLKKSSKLKSKDFKKHANLIIDKIGI